MAAPPILAFMGGSVLLVVALLVHCASGWPYYRTPVPCSNVTKSLKSQYIRLMTRDTNTVFEIVHYWVSLGLHHARCTLVGGAVATWNGAFLI